MILTAGILRNAGCCQSGIDRYFKNVNLKRYEASNLLELAIKNKDYIDAGNAMSKLMSKPQRVEWAIYCANQVLHIFENKHPDDKRPKTALEAAERWLEDPTTDNAADADIAADGATHAANDADDAVTHWAEHFAAYAAAHAAYAAADDADDADIAADAVDSAADANKKPIYPALLRKGLDIFLKD